MCHSSLELFSATQTHTRPTLSHPLPFCLSPPGHLPFPPPGQPLLASSSRRKNNYQVPCSYLPPTGSHSTASHLHRGALARKESIRNAGQSSPGRRASPLRRPRSGPSPYAVSCLWHPIQPAPQRGHLGPVLRSAPPPARVACHPPIHPLPPTPAAASCSTGQAQPRGLARHPFTKHLAHSGPPERPRLKPTPVGTYLS